MSYNELFAVLEVIGVLDKKTFEHICKIYGAHPRTVYNILVRKKKLKTKRLFGKTFYIIKSNIIK